MWIPWFSLIAAAGPAAPAVTVGDPYARASVTPASAAFMTLKNSDTVPHALVGVTSAAAGTIEIHTMATGADGAMEMRPLPRLDLAPGATATLAPGGMHVMLIGLVRPLAEGDTVELVLKFEDGTTLPVRAPVRRP